MFTSPCGVVSSEGLYHAEGPGSNPEEEMDVIMFRHLDPLLVD